MRPRRLDLAAIDVPVDLWCGEHKTSHSPDIGATLATRIPSATRHVVPGIGGARLWTHAKPMPRRLLEHSPSPHAEGRTR